MKKIKETLIPILSLFTSLSTLICCALPALLVSIGMGAAMISLTSNFPALIWLSAHKLGLFILAAVMLVISGYFIYKKPQTCPADLNLAKACAKLKKFNKIIFWVSVVLYFIGFFFAYIVIEFIK